MKENEPDLFEKVHKWMLPGDFVAMKFTDEIKSTVSGYSEGCFWDFKQNSLLIIFLTIMVYPRK
ncbi:MAG: hypothetical protein IPL08_02685 [Saprospiraceae bacterium]|nr:hypothetical protein [Saprospiraceae bacterium]